MSRNQYPGPCLRCGKPVPANEGYMLGKPGRWTVTHEACIPVAVPVDGLERNMTEVPEFAAIGGGFDAIRYRKD